MVGRIVGIYGPRIQIAADGNIVNAVVSGKAKYDSTGVSVVAVGDYVEYSTRSKNTASVDRILKRGTCISRPAVEREGLLQVIVSNIDCLVIITSIANPAFKAGLVDRYLIVAFKEKIQPIIVVNKIDLADPSEITGFTDAWQKVGCDIHYTSAVTGEGISELSRKLEAGPSVITGHSGVGKSSILNYINPSLNIKTSRLSLYSGKGVHTTSRVNLFQLFPDGWVADTPGLKDMGLAGIEKRNLYRYFPEFNDFEAYCQFGNCIHINEPDCNVKKAVEQGKIAAFRYQDYIKIYKSL